MLHLGKQQGFRWARPGCPYWWSSTCVKRTSNLLFHFFHFELEMVPVRGFAKGWCVKFAGIAA